MDAKKVTFYKKGSLNKNAKKVKISCLGDSITNGVGSNLDPSDVFNEKGSFKPYYRYFEDLFFAETVNCGANGSFVAKYDVKKGFQPNDSRSFVERYLEIPEESDIITIMGGVNDCQATYYTNEEFGSIEDKSNTQINTFCGALRTILANLKKKYPSSLIIYLTPLKYSSKTDGQGANWENNEYLPFYVEAIKRICKDFDVYVIDLYSPVELDFCHTEDDEFVYGDRLHFGHEGHRILGNYIINRMMNNQLVEVSE